MIEDNSAEWSRQLIADRDYKALLKRERMERMAMNDSERNSLEYKILRVTWALDMLRETRRLMSEEGIVRGMDSVNHAIDGLMEEEAKLLEEEKKL